MVVAVGARRASRWLRWAFSRISLRCIRGTPARRPTRWSCSSASAPAAFDRCPMDEALGPADDAGMARIGARTRLIEGSMRGSEGSSRWSKAASVRTKDDRQGTTDHRRGDIGSSQRDESASRANAHPSIPSRWEGKKYRRYNDLFPLPTGGGEGWAIQLRPPLCSSTDILYAMGIHLAS